MSDRIHGSWPKLGLERYVDYSGRFYHLNMALGSEQACERYYYRWRNRYIKLMKEWAPIDTAIWCIRLRRSLKEAYTATYFALSAERARQQRMVESYYYLSYYAVFHGMWATLLLHPNHTVYFISQVSHDRLLNIFSNEFCAGRNPIMSYNLGEIVPGMRFMREYYSYNMPMNHPDVSQEGIMTSSTGGIVKSCLQLANLHSYLVEDASKAVKKFSTEVSEDMAEEFISTYRMINTRRLPDGRLLNLEPSDSHNLHELLNYGCGLYSHTVMQEHFDDEFMNYGDKDARSPVVAETRSRVWRAFSSGP